jgi:hypothetical protein
MSKIARTGNVAEKILCQQKTAHLALGVSAIIQAPHGRKTDAICDSTYRYQLKNVDRTSDAYRGHSVDRRSWSEFVKVVSSTHMRAALFEITKKKEGKVERGYLRKLFPAAMGSPAESRAILERALMGEDEAYKPTHFLSTRLNAENTEIVALAICPAAKLLDHLCGTLYEHPQPVDTCIRLGPNIYLQRKGGDKNDSRADEIQTKIKFDESIHVLFTTLPLSVESTAECPV